MKNKKILQLFVYLLVLAFVLSECIVDIFGSKMPAVAGGFFLRGIVVGGAIIGGVFKYLLESGKIKRESEEERSDKAPTAG
jgi:hypothetical protein